MPVTECAQVINNSLSPSHTQVSVPIPTMRISTFTSTILTTDANACSNATTGIGVSNGTNYKDVGFDYQNLAPKRTISMNNCSQPPLHFTYSQPPITYSYSQPPTTYHYVQPPLTYS